VNSPYKTKTYLALALDPVHVGVGGHRLGRVDLPILRETGTGLPKIPGTSLSGPARAFAAMQTNRYVWQSKDSEYSCAGKGGEGGEKHCGEVDPACPVCVTYGFSKGSGYSMQGLAMFFDAQLVLFPVATIAGPVWVTSPLALEGCGGESTFQAPEDGFYPLGDDLQTKERINLGWLFLSRKPGRGSLPSQAEWSNVPDTIRRHALLVSDQLFSHIVNSNLEVRTSVSIDPETGAADDGALFTYEAIPRASVLRFEITCSSAASLQISGKRVKTEDGKDVDPDWAFAQVEKGLHLFEHLGIGGMNTRGMGRLRVLGLEEAQA